LRLRTCGAALALSSLLGCTTFPEIESDVCGNAVVDGEKETCDTFAEGDERCLPPGDANECQFDCALRDGTRAACPTGYGCSANGICLKPTGEFDRPSYFSADASSWVSAADFDGDGRTDIISTETADQFQQARFRLHYFDVDGKLVETRTFPRITSRPIPREVTGDTLTDLVFSNFRVGLLAGRADRDWVPSTFSSYVVEDSGIRVVSAKNDDVAGAAALVAMAKIGGVNGLYVPDMATDGLGIRAPLPGPVSELAGAPIAVDIIEGPGSPCAEIVLAYRGATSFRMYDMCEPGDENVFGQETLWRETPLEQVVKMPEGLRIDGGPLVADIDGDGHLDLLISGNGHPYLVHGDGQRLAPVATNWRFRYSKREGVVEIDSPDLSMPLAAGDFSGDGIADFVTSELLFSSRSLSSGTSYVASYQNRGEPWTSARIADLNGNGFADVVAASSRSPGLAFFNGTGSKFQVGTTLPTQGPVLALTTGDFDGDLIKDIAFVEGAPPSERRDSLSIAFGTRDLPPLTATHVADVSGVAQLGEHSEHGVDALFAASEESLDGRQRAQLTLFDGSPDRLPFAPYTLVTFATDMQLGDQLAVAITVGAFSAKRANDVVALGTNNLQDDWRFWLIPEIGGGRRQPIALQGDFPGDLQPLSASGTQQKLRVIATAADVDGDERDESVWLVSRGEDGCALLVYDVDDDSDAKHGTASQRTRIDLPDACPAPELAAKDLNGDGAQDLLVLVGDPLLGPRQLAIFWNDKSGRFSLEDRSFVSDPQAQDIRGFSAFAQVPRLAFVTDNALYTAGPRRDARQLDEIKKLADFHDARSVVVSDPNGDGIEDIVVADAEGLSLIEAQLK
jgi:hypothetical protein